MILKFYKFNENKNIKHDIKEILNCYLAAALWTVDDTDEEFEGKTIDDISDRSKEKAKIEIEWFVKSAGKYLDKLSDDLIGHDLWLTRNGHGTGFWDRGYNEKIEDLLVHLCEILGNADIYIGNDNKVYIDSHPELKEFNLYNYIKEKKYKEDIKKYNL